MEDVKNPHLLWNACATGPCPSIYRTEDGKIILQGYKVSAESRDKLKIPNHEDVIVVTEDLIKAVKTLL